MQLRKKRDWKTSNSSPFPQRVLALEMITNQNLSTEQMFVDIRGRLFDFWGVYGWLQKNISCRLISRGKKHAKKFLGKTISCTKKNILLMTYNAEKKSYSVMWGKKFLTPEVWEKIIISKSPIPPSSTYVQWLC